MTYHCAPPCIDRIGGTLVSSKAQKRSAICGAEVANRAECTPTAETDKQHIRRRAVFLWEEHRPTPSIDGIGLFMRRKLPLTRVDYSSANALLAFLLREITSVDYRDLVRLQVLPQSG